MNQELPSPEEIISRDGGRNYTTIEVAVMRKMMADLGLKAQEFIDQYAERMSKLIKSDRAIAEAVAAGDETIVDRIIELLSKDSPNIN